MKQLELVRDFHNLFEHPIKETIEEDEPLKIRQLRVKLLFEELTELVDASDVRDTMFNLCNDYALGNRQKHGDIGDCRWVDGDNVNKLEELDALCDIQYVLLGKVLTGGYHKVFYPAFKVVHENNMTKAHRDDNHATVTVFKSKSANFNRVCKDGKVLLYNSDGKLTKPWDHKKVSLEPFITGCIDMSDLLPREGMNTEEATQLVEQMKAKIEPYADKPDEVEIGIYSEDFKDAFILFNDYDLLIKKSRSLEKSYVVVYKNTTRYGLSVQGILDDITLPVVLKDLALKEVEYCESEITRVISTPEEVQKQITILLKSNNCTLSYETGRTNQSYGKYASVLIDDFEKVGAITVKPIEDNQHAGLPICVVKL